MTEQNPIDPVQSDSIGQPEEISTGGETAAKNCPEKRTTIGGQALIEGIVMFGPNKTALSVRQADGTIHTEEFLRGKTGGIADKIPVVRGCVRFFRQIVVGMRALMRSADLSEIGEETSKDKEPEKKGRIDAFLERHEKGAMLFTAAFSILFSVALFILLPRWIVDLFLRLIPSAQPDSLGGHMLVNLFEGIIRITIFILYLAITSRMKEIARVWMYHGAEHKSIRCYEAREPLTVENIRKYSTRHPRCGTAFLFIVILISILVFGIVGAIIKDYVADNVWWLNSLVRLALVPLIGGISYELLRFTGKIDHTAFGRLLTKPGMWLQRYTTREPDDQIIEVAIEVLSAVIPEKEGDDTW